MRGWAQVNEQCAVILGGVNIGVIRLDERSVLLVDSGLDRDSGRRAVRTVAEAGWGEVRGILTTHAHADHVGGHAEIIRRTSCEVWAPPVEAELMRAPELAPAVMFGSAAPGLLRGKFHLPAASPVDHRVDGSAISIGGVEIGVVALAGHAPGQVGYTVGDVCFAADVVFPTETLDKHRVPFIHSVTDHRVALETARSLPQPWFVSGHGPVQERDAFHATVDANAALLEAISTAVLAAVEGATTEAVIAAVLRSRSAKPADLGAWSLMAVTIRTVIADLADSGAIEPDVSDGLVRWRRV